MKDIPNIFIVKKPIGFCIVNANDFTIIYPNGKIKKLQQWELSQEKALYKFQKLRGII